jgi:uncharacterized oligopeptide transporter (OPT) family protein
MIATNTYLGLYAGMTVSTVLFASALLLLFGMRGDSGIIVLDESLRRKGSEFRTYIIPVAVGIYLPWSLGVPIFIGGIAAAVTGRIVGVEKVKESVHRGVLVGSRLIAGEALMGIIMASPMSKSSPSLLMPCP